jgi:hypothetical protein
MSKNFDEVQSKICRSQPIDGISNTLLEKFAEGEQTQQKL